ncbi:DUF6923 family protein [Paramicrobacterium fandaimingii]|uniref:DUF7927 domain-containing protein n=1 Tax=Paramicrobacterium fandaimingii TaxID=2708079 RepID=UPI00141E54AE|nr:DUF11 domain-containing protein [Microbacterium fandaimingii]
MAATTGLAVVGWVGLSATPAMADPFELETPAFWISQGGPTTVSQGVQADGEVTFEQLGDESGLKFNAMGFRSSDGYLWAIGGDNGLVRIGDDGVVAQHSLDLPLPGINVGAFGEGEFADRLLITSSTTMDMMYIVNVETGEVEEQPLTPGDTVGELAPDASDWTAYAGYLWGGQQGGGYIVRVDPSTGILDMFPVAELDVAGALGGAWTYGNNNLGFSSNNSGDITQVHVENPSSAAPEFSIVSVVPGPPSGGNDGANSIGDPTDLGVVKTAPPSVSHEGLIAWDVTVTNHSTSWSSGFTLTDEMPEGVTNVQATGPNASLCTVEELAVSCIGDPLDAEESVSYSFTGTAPALDTTLENTANVLANEDDPNSSNDTDSATTVVVSPHLAVEKSSSADGAAVAGDIVTFTVAVTNDGTADYTVDNPAELTDNLSDVLDDAEWNDTATVAFSNDSASDAPVFEGDTLTWSGPLRAGETATITYDVTVTSAGNHSIVNDACVPNEGEEPTCATTNTPLPGLAAGKTVDPESGSDVTGGQVLTYTLTYTNSGLAPATVDDVDTLTDLLDDADITSAPVSSSDSLTVSEITDGSFAVTGAVAPGATVTVTYQATVTSDANRTGDNSIVNWLLPSGVTPPADCTPMDCTVNPIVDVPAANTSTDDELAFTGAAGVGILAGSAGLLLLAGLSVLVFRRRRQMSKV